MAKDNNTKESKVSGAAKKSEDLKKKNAELEEKIKGLEASVQKEKDDYTRLLAEFETFRRRSIEEKSNIIAGASADTIKELLPVLDACEQAMAMLEKTEDEAAKEGTKLIHSQLMTSLGKRGLEKIEAKGEEFNTDFHEAVTQFPAPSEEMKGKVIDVTRTGYTLNGKVLRYAQVVVGV